MRIGLTTAHLGLRISEWIRQNSGMKKEMELRTKRFALAVIALVSELPRSRSAEVLGRQLLRSGTSVGANYREANRAASRSDFIHKLSICEKEAAETEYWLELLIESGLARPEAQTLLHEAGELVAIFVASGRTAKRST